MFSNQVLPIINTQSKTTDPSFHSKTCNTYHVPPVSIVTHDCTANSYTTDSLHAFDSTTPSNRTRTDAVSCYTYWIQKSWNTMDWTSPLSHLDQLLLKNYCQKILELPLVIFMHNFKNTKLYLYQWFLDNPNSIRSFLHTFWKHFSPIFDCIPTCHFIFGFHVRTWSHLLSHPLFHLRNSRFCSQHNISTTQVRYS